ncbi:DUF302 domain-containing protein [Nocardia sp. NPDC046763]|uniref:DUF302 domain-containing protein n=1 Tax=Nocardia sp. NPDC046763 TaxID=3155256 RepID=UPI0033C6F4AA
MNYRIGLCKTAPQTVVQVPLEIPPDRLGDAIVAGVERLAEVADRAGLTASGAPTITFHHESSAGDSIKVDFGLPIEPAPNLGPASGAELVVLPPTLVARTCHRGDYGGLDAAYRALGEWVREAGCTPIGPPTEAYLVGPDEVSDPRQLITEIRVPVAPAPAIAVHLDGNLTDAAARTREALHRQGFGVVAEIDMQAILREKAGEHIGDHLILEVCHPRLAARALEADQRAGLLLPTRIVLREDETGVLIEAADPEVQVRTLAQPALSGIAAEARRLLGAALAVLHHPAAVAG